jgi:hypothetical protein
MDRLGSPTATVTLTDDNNWIQTTSEATSKFPTLSNASALLTNGLVSSTGWDSLNLTTSALGAKIVSSGTTAATLIVTGSTAPSTYFNFVADDDASGNKAFLILSFKPQVQSVSAPANSTYIVGDALNFTVSFDSLINVTGTPKLSLTLNTGGTIQASYVSGSGSQNLVFRYTVASGNADADGVTVGVLALNGGTIRSDNGDDAELTLYSVGATTGVKVDGVVPTIGGVAPPTVGTYISGQYLDFTATFTKAMTVVTTGGVPYITLTIGGVTKHATYSSGSGSTALVFRYSLASGDAGALATGTGITLNGGTIKDAPGNSATLTFSAPTTSGITIDAIAPNPSSVTTPTSGTYVSGQNIDFTVNHSEPVFISGGTPYLSTTIGASIVSAGYVSGSGTTALLFRYLIANGDLDADGISVGTSISLNSANIKDAAGNIATNTFSTLNTTGIKVDAVAPTITLVSLPFDSVYAIGDTMDFALTFSEKVNVIGTPRLVLVMDTGAAAQAVYMGGAGTTALTFRYKVLQGQIAATGIDLPGAIDLQAGQILDLASNVASLILPATASTTGIIVQGIIPNEVPAALNQNHQMSQNDALTIILRATDADGAIILYSPSQALHGSLVQHGDTIVYTPVPGYAGDDQFSFTATDEKGGVSNVATIQIQVNPLPVSILVNANPAKTGDAIGPNGHQGAYLKIANAGEVSILLLDGNGRKLIAQNLGYMPVGMAQVHLEYAPKGAIAVLKINGWIRATALMH